MVATHASKAAPGGAGGKVRHRYYVSRALNAATAESGMRVPAREIEALVKDQVARLIAEPLAFTAEAGCDVEVHQLADLHDRAAKLTAEIGTRRSAALTAIVQTVRIGTAGVTITCDTAPIAAALGVSRRDDSPPTMTIQCAARLTRSGRALRLVQDNGTVAQAAPDASLVRLIVRARGWWAMLRAGELNLTELAARENVTRSYMARVIRLAFLAPAVTEAIVAGKQRGGVSVATLTRDGAIAADWREQMATLLPSRR